MRRPAGAHTTRVELAPMRSGSGRRNAVRTDTLEVMLNPLRSEAEAFRLLIYVAVIFGLIIAVVLIVRAL